MVHLANHQSRYCRSHESDLYFASEPGNFMEGDMGNGVLSIFY